MIANRFGFWQRACQNAIPQAIFDERSQTFHENFSSLPLPCDQRCHFPGSNQLPLYPIQSVWLYKYGANIEGIKRSASLATKTSCGYLRAASRKAESSAIELSSSFVFRVVSTLTKIISKEGVTVCFDNHVLCHFESLDFGEA